MGYSIKPGRGPSIGGGVGGLVAAGFGVFWLIAVLSMFGVADAGPGGGPPTAFKMLFVFGGIVFILIGLGSAVYHFYNAGAKNRMSVIDITHRDEEPDPIGQALGYEGPRRAAETDPDRPRRRVEGDFCPYCGARLEADYDFCPKCGKDV